MKESEKLMNVIIYVLSFAFILIISILLNKENIGEVDVLAFIGALLGGVITLVGVHFTIKSSFDGLKKQNEFEMEMIKVSNRPYLSVQDFAGSFKLHNLETSHKSRIIITDDYYEAVNTSTEVNLKSAKAQFYKFSLHGATDIVVNCNIKITLKIPGTNDPYIIEAHVGIVEKEEELFIPCYKSGVKELNAVRVEAKYTTVYDEEIYLLYDVENDNQSYWLIKDSDKIKLFDFELKNSNWSYPNRVKSSN